MAPAGDEQRRAELTPERWKQIDELVQSALERAPEDRAAFLAEACNGDDALRREVELLISYEPQASGFLEQAAFEGRSEVSANPARQPDPAVLGILEDYLAELERGVPRKQLGDYRIIGEIGRGGMGVVYEAEQISLKRRVALKVLPFAASLEGRSLERFKNEARAAAVLHHQHIVPVYSVGCERGVHYYTMQFIEGRTLDAMIRELREVSGLERAGEAGFATVGQVLSQSPSPRTEGTTPQPAPAFSTAPSTRSSASFRTAAHLGVQAAAALEYAHEFGIIHRDIKPANLMLDVRGDLWITDFGLAQVRSDARLTMTGDLIGTLRYMSPEQALGKRVLDHRTDIYSLGVTLYELVTLEPVFAGEGREELLRQIAFEEPKPPRRIAPAVPAELETIVLKAMAKNADERYATAKDLGDDLERFLKDEPIRARRPTVLQRARKWSRRHRPIVATAGVALVVLFVLALVGSLASNALIKRERDQARNNLFDAKLAEARTRRWGRQVGQRFASLQAITEAGQLARELKLGEDRRMELRNEAIACLALADIRIIKEWEGWPAGSEGLAFDGDLELYAYSDPRGNITVRRVADGVELARLPGEGPDAPNTAAPNLLFSPDGALLVARHHQAPDQVANVRIWNWRLGKIIFQPAFTLCCFSLDFSPDGRYLALGGPDGALAILEAATGNEVRRLRLISPPWLVAWSPDGSRLALVTSPGGKVEVRDAATGAFLLAWSTPTVAGAMAWSPDSTFLATGCGDGQVYLWDSATGQQHAVLQGHTADVAKVQFAPLGDLLLSSGWDSTCRLWDPWTGREVVPFGGDANRFSRDGRRLVSRAGSKVTIWEVASSPEYRALPWTPVIGREEVRSGGGLSHDGRWLAVAAGDVFRLWDLKSGRSLATLATTHAVAAAFHPSGTELFTSSHGGLYRWPWRLEGGRLRIGPASTLPVDGLLEGVSLDAEGRTLAVARLGSSGGASVLELESPASTLRQVIHPTAAVSTALSPDGKWVVTAVHKGLGVRVWDARSGRLIRELIPNEHNTRAIFSPDGRWLLTGTANEFCLWEVDSWQRVHVLRPERGVDGPGSAAFTFDGELLAVSLSPSVIQLLDVTTWRPLARLQGSDLDPVMLQGFTPDGSQLVVARAAGGARVWDLRRIREQLKDLGLDWDLPSLPPEASGDVTPPRVEVHLGSFGQPKRK
jgi:serine/threonine protein kinase/WD40 repeat protein